MLILHLLQKNFNGIIKINAAFVIKVYKIADSVKKERLWQNDVFRDILSPNVLTLCALRL